MEQYIQSIRNQIVKELEKVSKHASSLHYIEKPTMRQTLAYIMLPRILPRLYEIRFRFAFVAQLMAYLYAWIGLIPLLITLI